MKSFVQTSGGIDWYCQSRGSGPDLVLIPSGEGDCDSFARTADLLAARFSVLTFDTPGFSRTSAPPDRNDISVPNLGFQIAALVRSLGITTATFYGCSSGGVAVLDLLAEHPELVRNGIIHEAAIVDDSWPDQFAQLEGLNALEDSAIPDAVSDVFATVMNEDHAAWTALGPEYHGRLEHNFVTWVRHYLRPSIRTPRHASRFMTRPLAWTLGALSPMAITYGSLKTCEKAGVDWTLLPCKHFPQVSIPQALADHIVDTTGPHLDR